MDLTKAMTVSASGMKAQGARLRVIAENLANADSLAKTAGGDPYRRKTITFKTELDKKLGVEQVQVAKVDHDKKPFTLRYDPGHPAADGNGYVKVPNVNTIIEVADMREAQRSYEANLNMIEASKNMLSRTIDLLR